MPRLPRRTEPPRPPGQGPARRVAILSIAAALGCQPDATPDDSRSGGVDQPVDAAAKLEADPSARTLVEVLDAPYREVRRRLGPHRLRYRAHVELLPDEEIDLPKVGDRALRAESVDDELELMWIGLDEEDRPRFSLSQSNDHERGREVVMDGGRVYTRLRFRPWFVRDLEGAAHELWLSDAYRVVRDAVQLAGPRLAVDLTRDGDLIRVELSRSEVEDRDLVPRDERSSWRYAAEIDSVEGWLTVDPGSGAWRDAEITVTHHAESVDGRILRGRLELEAHLEPTPGARLELPEGALPSPERVRPQEERALLLDDLAAR